MGAYRGSFGELVECVLAHAAGDADGHGDLHSLGAPFYGGSAGGICYGDACVVYGHDRWPPVRVGAGTAGSPAGGLALAIDRGAKVSITRYNSTGSRGFAM